MKAIRDLEMLRGCGVSVWLGVRWVVGLSETPEPHEHKEARGVVLLLFETLKGDFEGSETAKFQFEGLGRYCETRRVVLDSPRHWIWAHCETSECFVGWVKTWHLCT